MSTFTLPTLAALLMVAMTLAAGCAGVRADRVSMTAVSSGYICPLTGEELPCPDCCPLNQAQPKQHNAEPTVTAAEGYECPLTGEMLPCPRCCPLNRE